MRSAFLPFAVPLIGEPEIAEVADSLRSGWLTTGPKVKRFEVDFARYIGCRHAIAVNSCTAALHVALSALGVRRGHEVIVPTFTFCSTANVVVHLGARPVLVDVGPDFNISVHAIEAAIGPRTKAIVPVHYSGQPCDMTGIRAVADRYAIPVVEDAAHALGAAYRGQQVGTLSQVTAFSFYATKNLTTGEGGMITTDCDEFADRMRLLSLHGMTRDAWKRYTNGGSWYYEVELAGYKDNMTDIQAAIGIHQLRRFSDFQCIRARYAQIYNDAFANRAEVAIPEVHADRSHAWHLYVLRLQLERLRMNRSQFIDALGGRNIGTSVHFMPLHLQPFYQKEFGYRTGDCPVAEDLYDRIVSLPLYPGMTEEDVRDVIEAVDGVIEANRV
jgi:dTDP-4-amino-4,6-dideoxygalactose transaminase